MSKDRINSMFYLDDESLEFVGIPATLSSPSEDSFDGWLVAFGVVSAIVVVALVTLIVLGQRDKKKRKKVNKDKEIGEITLPVNSRKDDDSSSSSSSSSSSESVGLSNQIYENEDEPQTAF